MTISSSTFHAGDTLNYNTIDGISGSYAVVNGAGVLTLTGPATPAQYQAALQSVTFSNMTNVSTAARSISIVTVDGSLDSNMGFEQVNVVAPVTVTGVYVNGGTNWSTIDSYFNSHSLGTTALGYALKTGSAELTNLPWSTITTISVVFSQPVNVAGGVSVAANSMALVGGTGTGAATVPSVSSFTTSGNTATWVFSSALGENQYVLAVASAGSAFGTPVTDANGAGLDGEFTKSISSFPSGNGLAGSQFNFFFNILPGDANQAAIVSSASHTTIAALNNKLSVSAGYNPYADIDGNGLINTSDAGIEGHYVNRTLNTLTAPHGACGRGGWKPELYRFGARRAGDGQFHEQHDAGDQQCGAGQQQRAARCRPARQIRACPARDRQASRLRRRPTAGNTVATSSRRAKGSPPPTRR